MGLEAVGTYPSSLAGPNFFRRWLRSCVFTKALVTGTVAWRESGGTQGFMEGGQGGWPFRAQREGRGCLGAPREGVSNPTHSDEDDLLRRQKRGPSFSGSTSAQAQGLGHHEVPAAPGGRV